MKQGIWFENCRIVTLDSNAILRYYYIGKKECKFAIDLKSEEVSVRFLFTQKKDGKMKSE